MKLGLGWAARYALAGPNVQLVALTVEIGRESILLGAKLGLPV